MDKTTQHKIAQATAGDIHAFQSLYSEFQEELKSYLFRLMANRADAEDIAHDTFIKAFDKIDTFKGGSSLKTWVFQIATHQAYNELKKRKRWTVDASSQAKDLVMANPSLQREIEGLSTQSEYGRYEIREHIDTCFTCIGKTLPLANQIALLLKEVYGFSLKEIMLILHKSEGQAKYLLQSARKTLTDIFEQRCALINKQGVCNQCSELNGWFNPKQNLQAEKMKVEMIRSSTEADRQALLNLRLQLIRHIDPLRSAGHELQEVLMNCNRMAMGEVEVPS